jgi:thymidylate kinase
MDDLRRRPHQREFEEKIGKIRSYLKVPKRYNGYLPRPFFVEITGSPSAGKTTTITELDKFFRRYDLRVLRPQEGAEVIRHIERTTPLYNIRTGLYALQMLIDLSHGNLYDVVIFDRCMFDAYTWMMYWRDKGKLSEEEEKIIQSFFLSKFWMQNIDAAYFMICDPKIAMERELRVALTDKLGETTNPASIEKLVGRYNKAYADLFSEYPQLQLFDTTHLTEEVMIETVAMDVLNALEKKAELYK